MERTGLEGNVIDLGWDVLLTADTASTSLPRSIIILDLVLLYYV